MIGDPTRLERTARDLPNADISARKCNEHIKVEKAFSACNCCSGNIYGGGVHDAGGAKSAEFDASGYTKPGDLA